MANQKIFFSYSRVDGENFALTLANDLRNVGANVWVDQLDIQPGKLWDLEIETALQTADLVLFIATEKSTTSNNVLNEVYYALEENKQVIPVIFNKCRIPFRLKRLQHIDFTDYDAGFNRLLKTLNLTKQAEAAPSEMSKQEEAIGKENQNAEQLKEIEKRKKEQIFWNNVINRNTIAAYQDYLDLYLEGIFEKEAIDKISKLNRLANELQTKQKVEEIQHADSPVSDSYNDHSKETQTHVINEIGEKKARKRKIALGVGFIAIVVLSIFAIKYFLPGKNKVNHTKEDSMAQKNLKASRMVNKAFEAGDPAGIDSAVASDFVDHTDRGDMNRDSLKAMIIMLRKVFPDMKTEIIKDLADDDYVFSLMRFTGTSNGTSGMPKGPYNMHAIQVFRFKDGKAVEHWEYLEPREMMKMMGFQPGMENKMDAPK